MPVLAQFSQYNRAIKIFKKVIFLIPIYNESENIEYLVQEILDTRNNYLPNMKVIFINDGSNDDSSFYSIKCMKILINRRVIES